MVTIVTNAQAAQPAADNVIEGEATPVEAPIDDMAQAARDGAIQDTPAEVEEPSSDAQVWDDLADDEDELDDNPVESEAESDEVSDEVEPPVEEVPAEKPADEIPPEVETPPEAEEQVPPEVPVETPAEETRTPEEVQAELTKARNDARQKLVDSFKWTEEQEEAFDANPGAVMQEMAADLFLDLYDSITQGMRATMPEYVAGIMNQQRAQQEAEQNFFGAWPQLQKPEYRQTVDRIAETYRQQYPNVDNATAIKEIGAQAWVALRLPLDELQALTQDAPVLTPETQQVPQSHTPANPGNTVQSARQPVSQRPMNEFEQLAGELIEDDEV